MEKTKKLIFSTKESLKWGIIVGSVAFLFPLWIFGAPIQEFWPITSAGIVQPSFDFCSGYGTIELSASYKGLYPITTNPRWGNNASCPTLLKDMEYENDGDGDYWFSVSHYGAFPDNVVFWVQYLRTGGLWSLPSEEEELRVFGVSPTSGSTATSTDKDFIIGWEYWDFEWIYKDFVFSFYEKNTGILTGSEIYEPTTENGTTTLNFSDFGFDKNGEYYFHAKARSYLYEYTAYYTGDLVYPEWWVNIQVEGWTPIFEMPVFEEWYSENSKFATSTAIFSGVASLLSPVYTKIGEFSDRVISFLNLNEAYDRGYDLGKIIPTFKHYIGQIEMFFGGFPIIQIFLAFLVILLGIFIVRLILKFIPGLG